MKSLITVATIMLLLISCKKDRLTANGNMTTETRSPGTFTGLRSSGATIVHVSYGSVYKVELKGSSNLIPYFRTNIVNGKLNLGYENVAVRHDDVEVFVTMPMLKNVALSGSGKVAIGMGFPTMSSLQVDLSGSGEIYAAHVLFAEEAEITLSGSGNVDLEKLSSRLVDARISGSGDIRIHVEAQLKASISGSGKVYYSGSPIVESHISGSGKIIKF